MSKNSTLPNTMNEINSIQKDENFKDVIRYKAIAALLIKFTIPEFNDKSLIEIARAIVDRRKRSIDMSDTDILEDEIDFLPSESGTRDEKNTLNDAVFKVKIDEEITGITLRCIDKEITVNTEMQGKTKYLGYSLVSRAVYYGASLLRDTVPAGDTKYENINKVYTIWFCAEDLGLIEYIQSKGKYLHRYGIRRFYDDCKHMYAPVEKESDLIEVIMIELPKIPLNPTNDTEKIIRKLFYDTSRAVDLIERVEKVNLTKIRKGVREMIDYEARTKARVEAAVKEAEARAEARAEEAKTNTEIAMAVKLLKAQASKNKNIAEDKAIKFLCDNLGLDADIAKRAYDTFIQE